MKKKWRNRQEVFSELSDFSQESFSGISVIKAFTKEFKELWAFKKINKDNENANIEFVKASTLLHILITLLVQSVMCLILGYGGYIIYADLDQSFTIGKLIEFMSYFNSCIWPMMALSMLIDLTSRGKASLSRISEFLDYKNNILDKNIEYDEEIKGSIEFKNLTFKYPYSDVEVLKDVSFKINAGENIGIIGKTGVGKTTIVDLILRLYNVEDNSIYIDGVDITAEEFSEDDVFAIRRKVGMVFQNPDNQLVATIVEEDVAEKQNLIVKLTNTLKVATEQEVPPLPIVLQDDAKVREEVKIKRQQAKQELAEILKDNSYLD